MRDAPQVKRLADSLRGALAGERIIRFHSVWQKLQQSNWPEDLPGRHILDVQSFGKNLLFHVDDALVLYSHLGQSGHWELAPRRGKVSRDRRVRVSITTQHWRLFLYHGPIFEVLEERALPMHHFVRKLGPCVLSEPFNARLFLQRLRQSRHAMREVADVLFDHEVVTGIGNCLKSEVLFAARVSPFGLVGKLMPEVQQRLSESLPSISQRAYRLADRTISDDELIARSGSGSGSSPLSGTGSGAGNGARSNPGNSLRRHYVYGYHDAPCLICGARIQRAKHGLSSRVTFYCPTCQPPP